MATEKDRPGVMAPPPLIFLAILIPSIVLARTALPAVDVPYSRVLGAVVFVVGLAFAVWAAVTMKRAGTHVNPYLPATTIVSTGPYGWSRNPIYIADAVMYIGLALIFHAILAVIFLPFALLVITFGVIHREEAYLQDKFCVEYGDYCRRVRRWL